MISLDQMAALARKLIDANIAVNDAELALAATKEAKRIIEEETIPSAMQELGLQKLQLNTGQTISVSQEVYASMKNADKPKAFTWLNENGFGGLLKVEVKALFGKGEQESAIDLARRLRMEGLNAYADENIHTSTLKAFLKEQLKNGADVPLDLFGARPVWVAKVK